jgi:hypothetical protein
MKLWVVLIASVMTHAPRQVPLSFARGERLRGDNHEWESYRVHAANK